MEFTVEARDPKSGRRVSVGHAAWDIASYAPELNKGMRLPLTVSPDFASKLRHASLSFSLSVAKIGDGDAWMRQSHLSLRDRQRDALAAIAGARARDPSSVTSWADYVALFDYIKGELQGRRETALGAGAEASPCGRFAKGNLISKTEQWEQFEGQETKTGAPIVWTTITVGTNQKLAATMRYIQEMLK
jgi:hypothetical protein